MNLLQVAPLCDSRGNVRYFLGAQIDVSGLAMEGAQMESLQDMQAQKESTKTGGQTIKESKSEFQELSELLSPRELQNVREHGGNLFQPIISEDSTHRLFFQDSDTESEIHSPSQEPQNPTPRPAPSLSLTGVYKKVSPSLSLYPDIYFEELTKTKPVPPRPPISISQNPLHFPLPPNPRHGPIITPKPHRRDRRKARQYSQRHDRWEKRNGACEVDDQIQ